MIGDTLEFLATNLNDHLASRFSSVSDWAVVSEVTSADGSVPPSAVNRIAITLVHVQQETMLRTKPAGRPGRGDLGRVGVPFALDLDVLVSANFSEDGYAEALTMLSASIEYFHSHPMLTSQSHPQLPKPIDRLTIELLNLDLVAAHDLWSSLGGRYLPSVFYKLRILTLDE